MRGGVMALAPLALLAACDNAAGTIAPTAAMAQPATAEGAAVATLGAGELADLIARGEVVLVDVRTPEEFGSARLVGGLNAPVETFDPATIPLEAGR